MNSLAENGIAVNLEAVGRAVFRGDFIGAIDAPGGQKLGLFDDQNIVGAEQFLYVHGCPPVKGINLPSTFDAMC